MARAKRTERAEARRRHRATLAADAVTDRQPDVGPIREPARPPSSLVESLRRGLGQIRPPDVRADVRAVPGIVRAKPWIVVPYALLVLGAAIAAVLPKGQATNGNAASFYVQLAFLQPTLLFFAAGFLAPRAAYLFGAILGLVASLLFVVLSLGLVGMFGSLSTMSVGDRVVYAIWQFVQFTISGAIFGWFAAWYRDFLRRSQVRSREAAEARKREQRRQTRRPETKPAAAKTAPAKAASAKRSTR